MVQEAAQEKSLTLFRFERPTIKDATSPRARLGPNEAVSRSGAIPEPTVIVRMRENGNYGPSRLASLFGLRGASAPIPVTLRKQATERIEQSEPGFLHHAVTVNFRGNIYPLNDKPRSGLVKTATEAVA